MDNKNISFLLPFRVGKKQERAVLDADGREVVVFPRGREFFAKQFVELMNDKYDNL